MRRELRNLKTGQHENKRENTTREMRMDEKIAHGRTGHATYDPRCEKCLKMPGVSTHPRKTVAEAAHFDYCDRQEQSTMSRSQDQGRCWTAQETFARAVHRKGANFNDLVCCKHVMEQSSALCSRRMFA